MAIVTSLMLASSCTLFTSLDGYASDGEPIADEGGQPDALEAEAPDLSDVSVVDEERQTVAPTFKVLSLSPTTNMPPIVIPRPAQVTAGDFLLAVIANVNGAALTLTPPADALPWKLYTESPGNRQAHVWWWYKIAGDAEPAQYTFTQSGAPYAASGSLVVVSGVAPSLAAAIDVGASSVLSMGNVFVAPKVVTTSRNTLLLAAYAESNLPFTPRWTAAADATGRGTDGLVLIMDKPQADPGASSLGDATCNVTATQGGGSLLLLALRPK